MGVGHPCLLAYVSLTPVCLCVINYLVLESLRMACHVNAVWSASMDASDVKIFHLAVPSCMQLI